MKIEIYKDTTECGDIVFSVIKDGKKEITHVLLGEFLNEEYYWAVKLIVSSVQNILLGDKPKN